MTSHPASASPSSAPAGSGSGFGEFFRYHGWLAPGVRLFRRMNFTAKALCVSLAFVIPLLMLLGLAWRDTQQQVDATRDELQGLAYIRPTLDLIAAGQDLRRAAAAQSSDLPVQQAAVKAAFAKLQVQEDALGRKFGTGDEFKALLAVHDRLQASAISANADRSFQFHTLFISSALKLINQVANGSQLILDPEGDSYHMMNVSVLRGPLAAENTARLRGMGMLVLKDKALSQARRDQISKWLAIGDFVDAELTTSYNTVFLRPDAPKLAFDMPAASAAAAALKEAVNQHVLVTDITADADAYAGTANACLNLQRDLVTRVMGLLDASLQQRIDRLQRALALNMGIVLAFIAVAGYLLLCFYKVMMGGMLEVTGHLVAMTSGNLTTAPRPWGRDEAAQLMLTLRDMQLSLRRIVGAVLDGAAHVQTASAEIATAAQDLSRRTEQSAVSLEETAASTEQIAATARQTAETVEGAMTIVRENASAAMRGGEVIEQVVVTMGDIRLSSNRIGEIIGVIDGIAFQTNILALNAAVEAARAGEQGRGFAVVATEVRALAGRSSAAAKEIKSLITASIERVEGGAKVVAHAGTAMGEIVRNADRIATLMVSISTATREQSVGVVEIGSAVHDIDQTTQQNAALVEQAAASTSQLMDQADRLAREIGYFRLAA